MSAGITSITGLQNLSNLQQFRADYNHLTSLDVSGLTNLTFLDVSDCNRADEEGANSLVSVNVTGCTNLESIYADDSDFSENGINSIIGLSGLTSLSEIDLDQCNIEGTVDLSMFSSLTYVDINGNEFVENLIIPSSSSISDLNADNNALTETSVNNILINLDNSGIENGYLDLANGENSPATGEGITEAVNLAEKTWTVILNSNLTSIGAYYDISDTGSVCNNTSTTTDIYTSGSLSIDSEVYRYNFGGSPALEGWYKPFSTTDLYFISGGLVIETGSCP